jgi:hypothetical protein
MSERTIQDNQDQILKTALNELERNRDILTGRRFRKWYQFNWIILILMLLFIPILCVILISTLLNLPCLLEMLKGVLPAIALGGGVGGLSFIVAGIDNLHQRIDKIVELTGIETKLEEKYYSNIKVITGSYPEKEKS